MYDYHLRSAMRLHLEADSGNQGTLVRTPGGGVLVTCGNSLSLRPRSELNPPGHCNHSCLIPLPSSIPSCQQVRCPTPMSRYSSSRTTCGGNVSRIWWDLEKKDSQITSWSHSQISSADLDRMEPAAESRDEKPAKMKTALLNAAKSQKNIHGAMQGSGIRNQLLQKTATSYPFSPIAKGDTNTDGSNIPRNQTKTEIEQQHLSLSGDSQKPLDHKLDTLVGPSRTQQHRTCFTHFYIFEDRKEDGLHCLLPNTGVSSSTNESRSDKIASTIDTKEGVNQKVHRSKHHNSVSGQFSLHRQPIASPVETKRRSSPTQISRDTPSDQSKHERRPLVPDRPVKNWSDVNVKPSNHQLLNVGKILETISFQRWSHTPLTTSDSDLQLLTWSAQNFLGKTQAEYRMERRTRNLKKRSCKVSRSSISLLLESFRKQRLDRARRKCQVKRRKKN